MLKIEKLVRKKMVGGITGMEKAAPKVNITKAIRSTVLLISKCVVPDPNNPFSAI